MSIRQHVRCFGIGIGPANLSLASLLYVHPDVANIFVDRQPRFDWHDGQLLAGATLQVSMLKDLVSLSDPTNPFSFLSYLHEEGRIYHFINAQFDAVPRREFRNYLEWASGRNPNLAFGEDVLSVDLAGADFVVETTKRQVTAENIAVGVGSQPWLPEVATPGRSQFHVSEIVRHGQDLSTKRVCVVGGGQSGAEAFLDLISRPPDQLPRRVSWISRRANYYPIDDSPFTNDFYMPSYSNHFYDLPLERRHLINERNVLSSDGISESTLREIYQQIYVHRFIDDATDLVSLHPNRQVTAVDRVDQGAWSLTLLNNDQVDVPEKIESDVIVWATGFRPAAMDFLRPLASRLEYEGEELRVDEDYAVNWDGPADRSIFVQNAVRGQRGLADPNLSLMAWRSERITQRLRRVHRNEQLDGFIDWAAKPADVSSGGA